MLAEALFTKKAMLWHSIAIVMEQQLMLS